jgi:glycosyltransferase involved in cell wall biosynthesis
MPKLILFAPNVGSGGGLVLLRELIYADNLGAQLVAIVDGRGKSQIDVAKIRCHVVWADASLRGRLHAEQELQRLANREDVVLCFHNLPPLLPNAAEIVCCIQNVFVIENTSGEQPLGWVRLRMAMERFIAARLKRRVARYVVQTPLMRDRLASWFGDNPPRIDVLPFAAALPDLPHLAASSEYGRLSVESTGRRWEYFYPSDGSRHKNHLRLFDAWCELADGGHFPSLAVTLHPDHDAKLLHALKNAVKTSGVRIENLEKIDYSKMITYYRAADALIFPSFAESFGLPLIEAARLQLPILAPELDYVRQVCEPSQTFDPFSPRSIAMAVLRHKGITLNPVSLVTASDFLAQVRTGSASVKIRSPAGGQKQ